jgi:hypothetical protein
VAEVPHAPPILFKKGGFLGFGQQIEATLDLSDTGVGMDLSQPFEEYGEGWKDVGTPGDLEEEVEMIAHEGKGEDVDA